MTTGTEKMEYFPAQPLWTSSMRDYRTMTLSPTGPLAQFYTFNASPDEDQVFTAVPDGTVDIFFRCCDEDPQAMVYGSVLKGKMITLKRNATYFGVRFFPGAAEQVLGCPLDLFTDQDVILEDVQDCASELVEAISTADTFEERIDIFTGYQEYCCRKYEPLPDLVSWVMERINRTNGEIRIQTLADETGYSARYVNKMFKTHIGVAPKFYERVVRFQNSLHLLETGGSSDFADLAHRAGYYDQAHFINEFREFSLSTPARMTCP